MMKRILLPILLLLALSVTAFAEPAMENQQLTVNVDGVQSAEMLNCVVIDGVVYAPVADVAAALGYGSELTDAAANFTTAVDIDPYFAQLIGTWHLYDGSGIFMTFNADGTGVAGGTAPGVMTVYFNWSTEGTNVNLEYTSGTVGTIVKYDYHHDENGNGVLSYSENPERKFFPDLETVLDPYFDQLIGTWYLYDGSGIYMTFNADGTGVAGGTAANVMTVYFNWSAADATVTLEYTSGSEGTIVLYEYIIDENGSAVMRYSQNPDRKFYRGEETEAAAADSGLAGMWSASLTDAECTLELKADSEGVMTVGTSVYKFVWSADGNNLTLTQDEAKLSGVYNPETGVLSVALGTINLEFTR